MSTDRPQDPGARPEGSAPTPRKGPSTALERDVASWGTWLSAGFEFAAAVVLIFLLGRWLDATWGTHPWGGVAGALLGSVVGTYSLIRKALASDRRNEPTKPPAPPDPSSPEPTSLERDEP